ncbi:hypothetical protein M2262_002194 [Pseudomonas sp. BIGb0408]|uniref:Uncharacterized protein n=1 Tax=Phytopseudomonas flavescens TaxID=29435 RepID=A0A7Y9XNI4_9GAMM|nr:hypothetical protein [Pseudomonas sp. BIGb0408]NYH73284.1 hypothetical protein [Pseudomonas flavescens]
MAVILIDRGPNDGSPASGLLQSSGVLGVRASQFETFQPFARKRFAPPRTPQEPACGRSEGGHSDRSGRPNDGSPASGLLQSGGFLDFRARADSRYSNLSHGSDSRSRAPRRSPLAGEAMVAILIDRVPNDGSPASGLLQSSGVLGLRARADSSIPTFRTVAIRAAAHPRRSPLAGEARVAILMDRGGRTTDRPQEGSYNRVAFPARRCCRLFSVGPAASSV